MITLFEKETHVLSNEELSIAKKIVEPLSKKIGKDNAITSGEITKAIESQSGIKVSGARLRKIINYVRTEGMVKNLLATSNGYYVAANEREKIDYIKSLRERASAISHVADCLENQ